MGTHERLGVNIHVDQLMDGIANNCPNLERLELRWDPENLRFSDKSQKAIDILRVKCIKLRCLTLRYVIVLQLSKLCSNWILSADSRSNFVVQTFQLFCLFVYFSDGRYYEIVKANFERADRTTVVRTTTCCRVSNYYMLQNYKDLIFNWWSLIPGDRGYILNKVFLRAIFLRRWHIYFRYTQSTYIGLSTLYITRKKKKMKFLKVKIRKEILWNSLLYTLTFANVNCYK